MAVIFGDEVEARQVLDEYLDQKEVQLETA